MRCLLLVSHGNASTQRHAFEVAAGHEGDGREGDAHGDDAQIAFVRIADFISRAGIARVLRHSDRDCDISRVNVGGDQGVLNDGRNLGVRGSVDDGFPAPFAGGVVHELEHHEGLPKLDDAKHDGDKYGKHDGHFDHRRSAAFLAHMVVNASHQSNFLCECNVR